MLGIPSSILALGIASAFLVNLFDHFLEISQTILSEIQKFSIGRKIQKESIKELRFPKEYPKESENGIYESIYKRILLGSDKQKPKKFYEKLSEKLPI